MGKHRDPKLSDKVDAKLWLTYYPQTDNQSEIANLIMLNDTQSKWERFLQVVKFAFNKTIHSSLGERPFEIIFGKYMLLPILRTKEEIFHVQAKKSIETSQAKNKKVTDKYQWKVN